MSEQTTEISATTETADTPDASVATEAKAPPPWFQQIFGEDGRFVEKWQEKLPPEMEPYKSLAADYPDFPSLLESFRKNKTAARERGNVKPLHEKSTPEEIADYREKMGIPPEPYAFEKPEQLPEGIEWHEERIKAFGEWAHSKNLTPAQAKEALDLHMKFVAEDYAAQTAAITEATNARLTAEAEELKRTYGGSLDTAVVAAKRAALKLNIPVDAMEPASPLFLGVQMLGVFEKVSRMFGESNLAPTAAVTNMDPARQAADIQMNPANPDHAAFMKGDPRVMAKVVELNRLGVEMRRRA